MSKSMGGDVFSNTGEASIASNETFDGAGADTTEVAGSVDGAAVSTII